MAYWLYCQACKQWSKSTTPLSDDKSCSHCNSLLVKTKPTTHLKSGSVATEISPEPEATLAETSLAIAETANLPEEPTTIEPDETLENKDISPPPESLHDSADPIIKEASATPEELTTEDLTEESEPEITTTVTVVTEETDKLATSTEPERNEIDGSEEETEPKATQELVELVQSPISSENTENNALPAEETIEELEPDTEDDSTEEEEVLTELEEQLADELLDDREALTEDEMEEPANQNYTPGHRMFLEDKRRRRKR